MNILADFLETSPKSNSGIYVFVEPNMQVVYYVGQSVNIGNRYSGHKVKTFLNSKNIKFKFLWKEFDESLLDTVESNYIKQFKPLLNHLINKNVENDLKTEYQQYIKQFIKQASALAKETIVKEIKWLGEIKKSEQESIDVYQSTAQYKVYALLQAIQVGAYYYEIKQALLSAPNKDTVFETEKGTFTGWLDFLQKQSLNRATVDNYIFMYEHTQEYEEMRLISKDPEDLKSGAAGHRKIASIKAVKWYLEKIAIEGEQIRGTLTACDYQKEIQNTVKKVKEDKYILRSEYEKVLNQNSLFLVEIDKLSHRIDRLEAENQILKDQLSLKQEPIKAKLLTRANR